MPDEATAYYLVAAGKRPPEAGEFLSDQQFAALVDVTTRTTLRWRQKGLGPNYVRAGLRRVLYRRSDVLAWVGARTFSNRAAEDVAAA
jgi:hypothetical protein